MSKIIQILFLAFCIFCLTQAQSTRYRSSSRLNTLKARRGILARQEAAPAVTPSDAVTPYPSADELKPEIPFNEVENKISPDNNDYVDDEGDDDDNAVQQPDEVYGPPTAADGDNNDDTNTEDDLSPRQPDEVYGPPEAVDEADDIGQDEESSSRRQPDEVYGPPAQAGQDNGDNVNDIPNAEQAGTVDEQINDDEQQQDDQFAPEPITEEPQLGRLIFGRRISNRRNAARPAKLQAAPRRSRAGVRTALRTRSRRQSQKILRRQIVAQPIFVYRSL